MKTIPVTQFVRPHGDQRLSSLDVSDEVGTKWETEIAPSGLRLTAERIPMHGDGEDQVCVAIENPEWGDYRMILYPNIPYGPVAREVEKMIMEFDKSEYDAWLQELMADED